MLNGAADHSSPEAERAHVRHRDGLARVAPHDLDAEAAVLSAMLIDVGSVDKVLAILTPTQFYSEANRWICEAVYDLHAHGAKIDVVTVAGWLRDHERLGQCGGAAYLAQISDAVPWVANVETYAQMVHDKWVARRVVATCQQTAAEGYDAGDSKELIDRTRASLAELRASIEPTPPTLTPVGIIGRWRAEGPLVRVATGIRAIDEACRGGLPIPWRMIIVGAPAAGKTFLEMVIAHTLATNGLCVGILGVDEEPEDLTVRLLQMNDFSIAVAELRDAATLDAMAAALANYRVRLYDASYTIETAGADLAACCKAEGRHGALFVDSIQAARSDATVLTKSPRELVEANVRAVRYVSTRHRLLVVGTCEANRASYRSDDASEQTNDMAAGAESRAIEFGAQTMLMLRTPKGQPDIIHARIAKNRRAHVGEFWLHIDRDRHTVMECGNPAEDPHELAKKSNEKLAGNRGAVQRDADLVADVVRHRPGIGEVDLRAALRTDGHTMGIDRLAAAKLLLSQGHNDVRLVNRGPHSRATKWHLETTEGP